MHTIILAAVPMGEVNLKGSWSSFWGAITGGFTGVTALLSFVGTALIVIAVAKWAWERRRGGSMAQGAQPLWGALIIGCLMIAPTVIMPLLLTILDAIANIGVSLFKAATGA